MGKSIKKYDAKKALAIQATAKQFQVTESYVRVCITGTASYGRSEDIIKYYNRKYKEVSAVFA